MSETPRTDEAWSSTYQCEKRLHELCLQLEKELAAMTKEANHLEELKNHNAELLASCQAQIEKMKCCENCVNKENDAPCYHCRDKSLWKLGKGSEPLYRCADRDDDCGHCPRSEPHEHPDEESGDDCDRRKGKVTCERV
jgi:hypothetical protein